MGLSLDFIRIRKNRADQLADETGVICFYHRAKESEALLYYRRNWLVHDSIWEMDVLGISELPQSDAIPLTKLQAHHLLAVVKSKKKIGDYNKKQCRLFINEFENLLKGFDFDEFNLYYCWIS